MHTITTEARRHSQDHYESLYLEAMSYDTADLAEDMDYYVTGMRGRTPKWQTVINTTAQVLRGRNAHAAQMRHERDDMRRTYRAECGHRLAATAWHLYRPADSHPDPYDPRT